MNVAIFCCGVFLYLLIASAFGRYILDKMLEDDDFVAIAMGIIWPISLPIYAGVTLGLTIGKVASGKEDD